MVQKKWLIILGIINSLAVAGIVFWYVNRDNTPPVITQGMEIVYEETMSDSELLQGAVAMDETDGDVSHTLVVEKVTVNHNTGIAMVTCGAMDESGNIEKQSFRMAMAESGSSSEDSESDQAEDVFTLTAGEAANGNEETAENARVEGSAEESENDEAVSSEDAESEDSEGTDSENEDADENANEDSDEENVDDEEADADSEEDADEQEAKRARAEAQRAQARNQQSEEIPVLNFGAAEVKTKKGYNPAWVSVISQLQDNKDSYETLLKNLQIAGEYTNATAGTYDVSVTTVDSDGNVSAARNIRIIVEE